MKELKIFNAFGIKPTTTGAAAGNDFFIPLIDETNYPIARAAWAKSYKMTEDEIDAILLAIENKIAAAYSDKEREQKYNILQLYLSLDSEMINAFGDLNSRLTRFFYSYLTFDSNGIAGMRLQVADAILINSGIKVLLEPDSAGIFFNKSGKGNKGFDVRACVVDEDYSGFVHLSVAYTKESPTQGKVYCGDKLTQMLWIPLYRYTCTEIPEDEYNTLTENFERGTDALGSSDVKH